MENYKSITHEYLQHPICIFVLTASSVVRTQKVTLGSMSVCIDVYVREKVKLLNLLTDMPK